MLAGESVRSNPEGELRLGGMMYYRPSSQYMKIRDARGVSKARLGLFAGRCKIRILDTCSVEDGGKKRRQEMRRKMRKKTKGEDDGKRMTSLR